MIQFLLHPKLRDHTHKDYRKAKVFAYIMSVILLFLIPYCIYFAVEYPEDTVKNWNNYICVSLFAIGISMLRFTPNFKIPLMYTAGLSFIPIMISAYHTGGVYSVDLVWMFVCIISQSIFIDYRWGIFSSLIVCGYITFLFVLEKQLIDETNFFKSYVVTHNSTHYYFTWIFVVLLMATLVGTFARVLENTNRKLEDLSKEKINELEIRVKQKTDELSQLRSSLARDFHDEMGNKLASINILSQSVAFTLKGKEQNYEAIKLLETIETRSRELFDGTKDFIWSIDFKSDYIFELFVYIRDFGEHFFNGMDISFYSHTNTSEGSLSKVKSTAGRQLVLVCKEIMTNAARHSQCTEIRFAVLLNDKTTTISLVDNGLGFDFENVHKRGLNNIQKRLEQIGAKHIISSSQKGTSFSIEIQMEG
jgi:signal transduction histidine kinase